MNNFARFLVLGGATIIFLAACTEGSKEDIAFKPQDALSDGVVSLAEYKQALDAESACVNEAGFQTSQLREQSDKIRWSYSVSVSGDADVDKVARVQDRCRAEYVKDVEKTYYLAHVPTGADRDAMFDDLIECLDKVGVTGVSRTNSEQEIVKAISTSNTGDMSPGLLCLDQYRAVFPEGMFPE